MTTGSRARAASIKARREALGITFAGFYDQIAGMTSIQATWIENGMYGKNVDRHRDTAEKFLTHLELKAGVQTQAPTIGKVYATSDQMVRFADALCQALLKQDLNIATIPVADFQEMFETATERKHFSEEALTAVFAQNTFCKIPFLISFGTNVVVICIDTLFAPAH
jgi:hypothetical protein